MVAGIRAAVGDEQSESLLTRGAEMSLDQALALVLDEEASLQSVAAR